MKAGIKKYTGFLYICQFTPYNLLIHLSYLVGYREIIKA